MVEQPKAEHVNGKDQNGNETTDGRGGVAFGTGVIYDDVYGAGEGDFVKELPTMEEERAAMGEDKQSMEMLDEGRLSSHPSTIAAAQKQVSVGPTSRNLQNQPDFVNMHD